MDIKNMNWDEVGSSNYISAEGNYTLKITGVAKDQEGNITQLSANSKEFHKYMCETRDGEKISVTLYLVEGAMWKYKKFLEAMGLNLKDYTNVYDIPNRIVGNKFVGVVKSKVIDKVDVETGAKEQKTVYEVAEFKKVEA